MSWRSPAWLGRPEWDWLHPVQVAVFRMTGDTSFPPRWGALLLVVLTVVAAVLWAVRITAGLVLEPRPARVAMNNEPTEAAPAVPSKEAA